MIDRAARAAVHAVLGRIRTGHLRLVEGWSGERLHFGTAAAGERTTVTVHSPALYRRLLRGSVGLGEAYADGLWDADDLTVLSRIAAREIGRSDHLRGRLAPLRRPIQRLRSLPALNTRQGARRNVAAHYDLGNDMFELFLDREWMMYSSAYFEAPDATLEQAQQAKLARICERLQLRPDVHVLEIGTGWGGLALYMASRFGCRVTTTTVSSQQREYAEGRIRAAGLDDRVRVLGADYRELTGRYDRLVSIEMIEAVGWEYLDAFFERCAGLLAADGLMFLQAITIDDRAYAAEKSSRSFANTLIFPGGCVPSLGAMQRSVARRTDLRAVFLEDIGPSYALTLRHWRSRFRAASEQLEELGYDGRFRRLWRLYLTFAEAGFLETRLRDLQIVFAKPSAHQVMAAASGSSPRALGNAASVEPPR
jgi:cyclopropane-fatty-acyl-phospholipid synthase